MNAKPPLRELYGKAIMGCRFLITGNNSAYNNTESFIIYICRNLFI